MTVISGTRAWLQAPLGRDRDVEHDETVLEPGDWFACDFPERPVEYDHTVYLSDCYACRLALRAAVVNGDGLTAEELENLTLLSLAWGVS